MNYAVGDKVLWGTWYGTVISITGPDPEQPLLVQFEKLVVKFKPNGCSRPFSLDSHSLLLKLVD